MPFSFDEAAPLLSLPFSLLETDFDFGFDFGVGVGVGVGSTPWPNPAPLSDQTGAPAEPDRSLSPPEPDRALSLSPAEQRRLRRMISNRESARRSRMRKKRHLEELRCRLARLRAENRDLASRLGGTVHRCALLRRDSDRLRAESASLQRRLARARRVLLFGHRLHLHLLASSPKAPLAWEQTLASLIV